MRKGTKRKTAPKEEAAAAAVTADSVAEETNKEQQNHSAEDNAKKEPTKAVKRARRTKPSKPESEPEYFPEQRDLEDLWKQVFPVGTEWDLLDLVYQYKWNFSNLENAFEEGGELHGKKVYLFGGTEPQMLFFQGQEKVTCIPVVVAVVSPIPPSDKIGINSVQMEAGEIVPMKQMKMDWVPYIPLGKRDSQVERLKSQIFILSCLQRRAGLRHMKIERVKKFEYCLPFLKNPLKEEEIEQSTILNIMYPVEPPVVCEFDWELDELEEFTDNLVEAEELSEDQKDAFKEFVKEKVREAKKANREAREARKKDLEELSEERKTALQNMRFYKFYPVATSDSPDVSKYKSSYINRYYGKAHQVL